MAKAKQNAFFSPVTPSKELAEITGSEALPRTEVVKKMWAYINRNNLQNPKNKREHLRPSTMSSPRGPSDSP